MRILTKVCLFATLNFPVLASAEWTVSFNMDEISGDMTTFATSPRVSSTGPMSFPYSDVASWLGFGCKDGTEWAFVGFSTEPNLIHEQTEDGYDSFRARTRWGDRILRMQFSQDWGSRFIHFDWDSMAIAFMEARHEALLELPWYGQDSVVFQYSLDGAAIAIREARNQCLGNDSN